MRISTKKIAILIQKFSHGFPRFMSLLCLLQDMETGINSEVASPDDIPQTQSSPISNIFTHICNAEGKTAAAKMRTLIESNKATDAQPSLACKIFPLSPIRCVLQHMLLHLEFHYMGS